MGRPENGQFFMAIYHICSPSPAQWGWRIDRVCLLAYTIPAVPPPAQAASRSPEWTLWNRNGPLVYEVTPAGLAVRCPAASRPGVVGARPQSLDLRAAWRESRMQVRSAVGMVLCGFMIQRVLSPGICPSRPVPKISVTVFSQRTQLEASTILAVSRGGPAGPHPWRGLEQGSWA